MLVRPGTTWNLQGRKQERYTFLLENQRTRGSLGQRPADPVHLEQSPSLWTPPGPVFPAAGDAPRGVWTALTARAVCGAEAETPSSGASGAGDTAA